MKRFVPTVHWLRWLTLGWFACSGCLCSGNCCGSSSSSSSSSTSSFNCGLGSWGSDWDAEGFKFDGGPEFTPDFGTDDIVDSGWGSYDEGSDDACSCNDGDPCTVDECTASGCLHFALCEDDDVCTLDLCQSGVCSNPVHADGAACDAADSIGTCIAGECVIGSQPVGLWPTAGGDARHSRRGGDTLASGEPTQVPWNDLGSSVSEPVVAFDGTVVVGAGAKLVALDATGIVDWTVALDGSVFGAPTLCADRLVRLVLTDGRLVAYREDHTMAWETESLDAAPTAASVGADRSVIGTADGMLHAFDPSGVLLWTFPATGPVLTSPARTPGGAILVTAQSGALHSVQLAGEEAWSWLLPGATFDVAPAVTGDGDGLALVAAGAHGLFAIAAEGALAWAIPIEVSALAVAADDTVVATGADGAVRRVDAEGVSAASATLTSSPLGLALDAAGTAVVTLADGTVVALAASGEVVWTVDLGVPATTPPVIAAGRVLIGVGSHLVALIP